MQQNNVEHVFSAPGRHAVIDFAIPGENGVLVSFYERETLEQVQVRYPGAILTTYDEAVAAHELSMKREPVEITPDKFFDMLEVLPPHQWVRNADGESFKMIERTSGNITGIYARIGKRYFSMEDSIFMKHDDIMTKILSVFPIH